MCTWSVVRRLGWCAGLAARRTMRRGDMRRATLQAARAAQLLSDEPPKESDQGDADSNPFEYRSRASGVKLDLAHHGQPVFWYRFAPAYSRRDRSPEPHDSPRCHYGEPNDANAAEEDVEVTQASSAFLTPARCHASPGGRTIGAQAFCSWRGLRTRSLVGGSREGGLREATSTSVIRTPWLAGLKTR